jgi:hypothetical protein
MISGLDGSLWVIRSTSATEVENPEWDPQSANNGFPTYWVEPMVADVFDADGRYLGPVKLPDGMTIFPPPVVTGDRVWAVSLHELGYQQLVRYSISR